MQHPSRPAGHSLERQRFTGNIGPAGAQPPAPLERPAPPGPAASPAATAVRSRPWPFTRPHPPGAPPSARPLDEHTLPPLLEWACDPRGTPGDRAARFQSIVDQLPARNDANGPLHAQCLRAMLSLSDPVERRHLFGCYHQRNRFSPRTDSTPRLFHLVSRLQKPEHRSTEDTWEALERVCLPGPSTNWPVWRGLCRLLATQMAEVIQAFQRSRESPANKRRFNELVLRVVLRLSAPVDRDGAKAIDRQFELLSDLMQAIPADHRPDCLRSLESACAEWIGAEMPPDKPMPFSKLALLASLRLLGESYGQPARGQSPVRLGDSGAEAAVQVFADRLRQRQFPQGASKL